MRRLAIVLVLAAICSFTVSLASRGQFPDARRLTEYTPRSNEAVESEYDGMRWNDARLWLGLALSFAVSGIAVVAASAVDRQSTR